MGCSGFVDNVSDAMEIEIRCYKCGKQLILNDGALCAHTLEEHSVCTDVDGKLPIDIEYTNYTER